MDRLNRAILIAKKYHLGQLDKAGKPYIEHPLRVMERMKSESEKIVAVLHDVLEDNLHSKEEILFDFKHYIQITEIEMASLLALTRMYGEKYTDFILRLSLFDLATAVKIEDILDNLDVSRFDSPEQRIPSLEMRYKKALIVLEESLKD